MGQKKMRLLVLSDRYPPYYEGGYELMCQRIVDGLKAKGHELLVLTTTWGAASHLDEKDVARLLRPRPVQMEHKAKQRWHELMQIRTFKEEYDLTHRMAAMFAPDFIFAWHLSGASPAVLFAAQDLSLPVVYAIGSTWLLNMKQQAEEPSSGLRKYYRSALMGFRDFRTLDFRKMILVSPSLNEKYTQAGFDLNESMVIPNGIPQSWVENLAEKEASHFEKVPGDKGYRLLYVGRIEAAKGVLTAFNALKYLIQEKGYTNLTLDLIGKGEAEFIKSLKKEIIAAGLEKAIHLVGFLSQEELRQKYGDYDLFLFPSIEWEGFGMTLLEAMSQGLPVIATNVGGPGDLIVDGENGLLVVPGSVEAFAAGIDRLLTSPELRQSLGQAARATVRTHFIFEKNLENYEAYLQSRLAQGPNL